MFQDLDDLDVVERRQWGVVVENVENGVSLQTFEHVSRPVGGVREVRGGGGRVEMGAGLVKAPLDQLHLEGESATSLVEQWLGQRHLCKM